VDVSKLEEMEALAKKVFADGGQCHFLMNNAGIGAGGGAVETPMDTVHRVMGVNTYGPIHGCLAFVPHMKASGEKVGLVVNTGSKQGITMPPGNLTYNMSKAALKCYTEGLEHEFGVARRSSDSRNSDETQLYAALLVPGWVNTSIFLKAHRDKAVMEGRGDTFDPSNVFFHEDKPASGAWMPSQVVDFLFEELSQGRFYIICPDNDVSRETDKLRMTWTMQDITEDRPPLSRWHPDYKQPFADYSAANTKNETP
jgi:NAD(P)-dependent dehydrogenase (short-subunit alcohol dehydrogenase family)